MNNRKYTTLVLITVLSAVSLFSATSPAQESSMSDAYVFLKAVKDRDYAKVKNYLQRGANVNKRGYDDGETAVYVANITDRNGETALFKAVIANDRASVKTLLEANADWSIADNTGRTPLDLTLENRRLRQVGKILQDAGAEY